jgi:hypothetical protein
MRSEDLAGNCTQDCFASLLLENGPRLKFARFKGKMYLESNGTNLLTRKRTFLNLVSPHASADCSIEPVKQGNVEHTLLYPPP